MVNANTSGFDFYAAPIDQTSSSQAIRATRDYRNTMTVTPVLVWDKNTGRQVQVPKVKEVTFLIQNLSGGMNRERGVAREASPYYPYSDLDRVASSSAYLVTKNLGAATLPYLSFNDPCSTVASLPGAFGINIFSTYALGMGDGVTGSCLFKETSVTNPILTNITYAPARGNILHLGKGHIANAGEYLFVSFAGGAINVLSDLTAAGPTSVGNMNANTNPSYGIMESPVNASSPGNGTLIGLLGTNISSLGTEQAIGTAFTNNLTNVPSGGHFVGFNPITLPGTPVRIYLILPRTSTTQSIYTATTSGLRLGEVSCHLYSLNLEGTDIQQIKAPIANIYWAEPWGNSIVVSDGISVWQYSGSEGWHNLGIFTQRATTANTQWKVQNIQVCGNVLRVPTVLVDHTTGTPTYTYLEEYNPATGSWNNVLDPTVLGSFYTASLNTGQGDKQAGARVFKSPGPYYSESTGFMHEPLYSTTTSTTVIGQYVLENEQSAYYFSNIFQGYYSAAAGSVTSPILLLEGMEGKPMVLAEIQFLGDIGLGNAAAGSPQGVTWKLEVATVNKDTLTFTRDNQATFTDRDRMTGFIKKFSDNTTWSTHLQYKLSLSEGSTTTTTPNGLPFRMKFLVFDEPEDVRSPQEVYGWNPAK